MSGSKPVLVIMTAGNCGACQSLKKVWPSMKAEIEKKNLVTIVEADRPQMKDKLGSDFPSDLNRYTKWFPMFILFDGTEWAAASSGGQLNGVIFHGIIERGGSPEYAKNSNYSMKAEGIIQWIQDNIMKLMTDVRYKDTTGIFDSPKSEIQPIKTTAVAPLLKPSPIQPLVPKVTNPTQGKPDLKIVLSNGQTVPIKTVTGSTSYVGTEELISTCQTLLQTRRRDNP